MPQFYRPPLDGAEEDPFARDGDEKLIRRGYWLGLSDRSIVLLMTQGIGAAAGLDQASAPRPSGWGGDRVLPAVAGERQRASTRLRHLDLADGGRSRSPAAAGERQSPGPPVAGLDVGRRANALQLHCRPIFNALER